MHTKDTNTHSYCAPLQPVVILLSRLQLCLIQFIPLSCSPTLINAHCSLLSSTASHCVCDYSFIIPSSGWEIWPYYYFQDISEYFCGYTLTVRQNSSPDLWLVCTQSSPSTWDLLYCIYLMSHHKLYIPATQPDGKRHLQGNYCNTLESLSKKKSCVNPVSNTFLTQGATSVQSYSERWLLYHQSCPTTWEFPVFESAVTLPTYRITQSWCSSALFSVGGIWVGNWSKNSTNEHHRKPFRSNSVRQQEHYTRWVHQCFTVQKSNNHVLFLTGKELFVNKQRCRNQKFIKKWLFNF